jgi:hypothetical protein
VSQSDSFIDEVTEEVRRDRLFALMRRYGWIAVLAVVVLVGGAAWNEYRKVSAVRAAHATGDAMIAALRDDDPVRRAQTLAGLQSDNPGARAVAAMLAAGEQVEAGEFDAAIATLNAVAEATDLPLVYRQVAAFKTLTIKGDKLDPEARRAGYQALIGPGSQLRLLAEEQLAMIDIETGETPAALTRLQAIVSDAEATAGLRRRATQLIVSLGGVPDLVPGLEPEQTGKNGDQNGG